MTTTTRKSSPHGQARAQFLATMEREGMPRAVATKILRHSQTWWRLTDWRLKNCPGIPSDALEARAERLIREGCKRTNAGMLAADMATHGPDAPLRVFIPTFTTDPARVTIRVPSGAEVAVPTR